MPFMVLAWALASALVAGQTSRPVTLVSEVRAAIAAHDLAGAEALIVQRRAQQGQTSEVNEALSWLGRGALAERQLDRAERFAAEAQTLTLAALGSRSIDEDAKLANALGAAIEVQPQVATERGARSDAIVFLERELKTYRRTGIAKRIQK